MKEKYYHASFHQDEMIIDEMKPSGYYERAEDPTSIAISHVKETCFSKSKEGSIVGKGRSCAESNRKCILDLYVTEEDPDVDLSNSATLDFDELEEVRYRRTIPVEKALTVELESGLPEEIASCYGSEEVTHYDGACLEFVKEHIKHQLNRYDGKDIVKLKPLGKELDDWWEESFIETFGSKEKYRQFKEAEESGFYDKYKETSSWNPYS